MKGAREYCRLFGRAEQHGRLYLVPHHHARGKTFRIYVLPECEMAIPNGDFNPPLNKDAVEVYGIISGDPGWSEVYGWLHEGPWQDDFKMICGNRERELRLLEKKREVEIENRRISESARIAELLGSYR